jgi:hypothetical protein
MWQSLHVVQLWDSRDLLCEFHPTIGASQGLHTQTVGPVQRIQHNLTQTGREDKLASFNVIMRFTSLSSMASPNAI